MSRRTDEHLDGVDFKPTRFHRILHWFWRRDIDPENLAVWIAAILLCVAFWAPILWAIWKLLR